MVKNLLQTVVSVYPSCKANVAHNDVTLIEVFEKVKNDEVLRLRTEAYRDAIARKVPEKELKELKAGTMPVVLPAVRCEGGRKEEHIREYTMLCQADFDGVPAEMLPEMKRRLRELPFVLMYYVSMSGKGLHVFYAYRIPNSGFTPEVYVQAFRQGNARIASAIVADFDPSVEPPVHLSALCHDPEAWCNPEAEELVVDMSEVLRKPRKNAKSMNDDVVDEDKWSSEWTTEKVYALAKDRVEKSSTGEFAHGNRNNFLVHLAMTLSDFGMKEEHAAQLMEQEYSGQYGEEPIPSMVRGCYRTVSEMYGRRALPRTKRNHHERHESTKIDIAADFIRTQNLRYDVISRKIMIDGREITDRDINSMLLSCNVETGRNISAQVFRSALMSNCVQEFNPLTEYLSSLDLKPFESGSYDSPIERAAGCVHVTDSPLVSDCGLPSDGKSQQELWTRCFKKWFVAMVAAWIKPEVVNHQMIVLIGAQGIYKSTWLDSLIPKQLIRYGCRQSCTDFGAKDEQLRCTEFGLINLDEFDRLTGKELDMLKSLITVPDVNVRAPYGIAKERRVRIASYCASGNKLQFLTDQTGNRRFLPFYVSDIVSPFDHPIDHDAMYAEAMWLIGHTDFNYWFSTDEIHAMSGYVEQFADRVAEEDLIDVYFDRPKDDPDDPETRPVTFLTPSEILAKLTLWGNIKKPISTRTLNTILDKKGFKRVRLNKNSPRGYLMVELDAATINSRRQFTQGTPIF